MSIDDSDPQKLTFLYQLHDGPSVKSLGIYCAKLVLVPEEVIERANQISLALSNFQPIEPLSLNYKYSQALQALDIHTALLFDCETENHDILIDKLKQLDL